MSQRPRALTLALLAATIACDVPTQTQPPTQPAQTQPWSAGAAPLPSLSATSSRPAPTATDTPAAASSASTRPGAPVATTRPGAPATKRPGAAKPEADVSKLTWQQRTAIAIGELQQNDPKLYKQLYTLKPNRRIGDEQQYTQTIAQDPQAAPVFLQRLLNGRDSIAVRLALVDALPSTGGDWQEGLAALVAIDASPRVRKKLVEMLRYVAPPHDITGLRHGFHDEDSHVRAAAARTTGFARDGIGLFQEVVSMTFDDDWDTRAAAAQSLGKFGHKAAWPQLVRLLGDPHPEVRLQVLIALEHIDAAATSRLPELDKLAKDRQNPRLASLARRLKAGSPGPKGRVDGATRPAKAGHAGPQGRTGKSSPQVKKRPAKAGT